MDRESWKSQLRTCCVRIQWDPERSVTLQALEKRTIQIGLSGAAMDAYVDAWIAKIEDITPFVREVETLVRAERLEDAQALLPVERPYPLPPTIARQIGSDDR